MANLFLDGRQSGFPFLPRLADRLQCSLLLFEALSTVSQKQIRSHFVHVRKTVNGTGKLLYSGPRRMDTTGDLGRQFLMHRLSKCTGAVVNAGRLKFEAGHRPRPFSQFFDARHYFNCRFDRIANQCLRICRSSITLSNSILSGDCFYPVAFKPVLQKNHTKRADDSQQRDH